MADTRLYHGGAPGLAPGDLIKPRGDDQAHLVDGCPTCEARRQGAQLPSDPVRQDRVYVTRDRGYARLYAAGYPRGSLYVVEPVGEMEPVVGDDPVPSWAVPAARVVSVYDPVVVGTAKDVRRWRRLVERGAHGRV